MSGKLTPCGNCPFRLDVPGYIRPERGQEIRAALLQGGTFPCHKTVDYSDEDEGDGPRPMGRDERWCAGALITMEHTGGCERNQMVRIASRLGILDLRELDMDAPVAKSWREWRDHLKAGERA